MVSEINSEPNSSTVPRKEHDEKVDRTISWFDDACILNYALCYDEQRNPDLDEKADSNEGGLHRDYEGNFGESILLNLPHIDHKQKCAVPMETVDSESEDFSVEDEFDIRSSGQYSRRSVRKINSVWSEEIRITTQRYHYREEMTFSRPAITASVTNKDEMWKRLNQLRLSLRVACAKYGEYHQHIADRLTNMGDAYERLNEHKMALESYTQALSIYSVKLGDFHKLAIHTRMRIGNVHRLMGDYIKSLEFYGYVIDMVTDLSGEDEPLIATIYEEVAVCHCEMKEYVHAMDDMKKAVRSHRKKYGDVHEKVVLAVESIGMLCTIMGENQKATVIFAEAVKIWVAIHGEKHINVANSLVKWGLAAKSVGDYEKALKILKKAFLLYQEVLHAHPSIVVCLSHIGNLYLETAREDKAMKAHTRALKLTKKNAPSDHLLVADSLVNVAKVFIMQDDDRKGYKCLKEALTIYKQNFGSEHVTAVDTAYLMCGIHLRKGEVGKALRQYNRILIMKQKSLSDLHPEIALICIDLARAHCQNMEYAKSIEYYSMTLKIHAKTIGPVSEFADTLMEVGNILQVIGNMKVAEFAYKTSMDIYESEGDMESKEKANDEILNLLGRTDKRMDSSLTFSISKIQPFLNDFSSQSAL